MSEGTRPIRKLRAILSADVKGYSLLMARDENFTINTLKDYRNIMFEQIVQHKGRVIDSPGDNILADFASVVDAVTCAVEIQKILKEKNNSLPDDKKLEFRIGVNIGDVIQDGDRIYGNGVNVAARIEGLADPGGISISSNAFGQVKDKLTFGYEYQGEHEVKNIKDPIKVYKVLMADEDAGKLIGEEPSSPRKKWVLPLIIVTAIIITSLAWHFYQSITRPDVEPASLEEMELPLPDKPSIAIMPFDNLSDEPGQDYFSDGLTEDIITALSKVPKIFVISRDSVFTFKDKTINTNQVAEKLGVRYVLEGSIRKSGDKMRITAQLIDAISGHHLWAEQYDRDLKDIFAVQDDLTKNIITAMQVKLTEGEQAKVDAKGTDNLQAYLKCLQAREQINRFNLESNELGKKLAQESIELDPQYAMAYRILSAAHRMEVMMGVSKSPKKSTDAYIKLLKKAIELDESYAEAYGALAFSYSLMGKHEEAMATAEKAVALDPNSANTHAMHGHTLRMADKPEEAILAYKKAIRLNPIPPTFYLFGLGLSYSLAGQYDEGIEWCEKAVRNDPNSFFPRLIMAAVYSMAGQIEQARVEASEAQKINSKYSLAKAEKRARYKYKERMFAALRRAGFPEYPPGKEGEKPSIAVLPFVNMSDDPEQEYFSDGLTDEIITTLSKCPRLFVIARDSVFSFKDKKVPLKKLSKDFGVRYLLEGSVRKSQNRLRISAQLIDAITEHTLWAERYEKPIGDIFAIQDEITLSILRALQVNLSEGDQARLIGKKTNSLDAYLKAIQAQEQFYQMNRQGSMKAKELGKESIALDPKYAFPYTILANTHMLDAWFKFSKSPGESMKLAAAAAEKALSLDDLDPAIYSVLSNLFVMQRQYEKAISAAGKAIELSPGGARAHFSMGIALQFSCKFEEAIPYFEEAIRLNPYPPGIYFRGLASVYRFVGRYDESLIQYEKALDLNPGDLFSNLGLTSLYISINRIEDAKHQAREVLRLYPNFSLEYFAKTLTLKDQSVINAMIENLRKAGLS